ncbi:hypothetical protein evm_010714 [Chilo suppressalis]|nr:hypothetical protein evm_010714 [Chilo suppressalis]
MERLLLAVLAALCNARQFCERSKMPLEVGEWRHNLQHLDAAAVENGPVSITQGQVYVYENYFPGYTIRYIHVDNLARRTCGASATLKSGGVGTSSVLVVLQAEAHDEIKSVVDVWGTRTGAPQPKPSPPPPANLRSLYLFKTLRAVNHNKGF